MALHSSNHSDNCETCRETPHAPKIPGHRGVKLLKDVQRATRATFGRDPCQLLPRGENDRDITIYCLQRQLAELTQIMVDNRLMKPIEVVVLGQV